MLKRTSSALKPARRAPGTGANPTTAAKARAGHVNITGYFPVEVRSSLRLIQAKHPDATLQDLIGEALNLLFSKYGVPQAAPKPEDR